MTSGQIKQGNIRLDISISARANEMLRDKVAVDGKVKKGTISSHIEHLILEEDNQP
jgi:hypothetical protein